MDKEKVDKNRNGDLTLIITVVIANHFVSRIMVDSVNSCNPAYLETLAKLWLGSWDMRPLKYQSIVAFNDFTAHTYGQIHLYVTLGKQKERKTLDMCFFVIPGESVYNSGIIDFDVHDEEHPWVRVIGTGNWSQNKTKMRSTLTGDFGVI